ncbi:MAG: C4-type zinc ribbon domain-containing protein [Spirochaetales bacterium]|jgi:predicted  nucleic acid-binding Zn-ribbon protein|nr:C4-type zinc ribbon domain-containing protein [Spirochaetales bacterium]
MIEELFDKLKSLQDILSQKFVIEAEIRDIPKSLATRTELVNRLKKSYIEKNEQYEQARQRIKNLKEKMQEAEESREKLEGHMDQIKTQREYEALDKEIRDASEKELQFRKELQREEKNLEEMSHAIEREESLIKEQDEELAQEQAKIKSEIDQKQQQLVQLEMEETKVNHGLDPEMLFKFERIIRSKSGLGIVPLKRGVCSGCHMILPMQFVNDVRVGKEIRFCPYCSRILFFQDDGDEVFYPEAAESIFNMDDIEDEDNDFTDEDDAEDEDEESGAEEEEAEEEEEV